MISVSGQWRPHDGGNDIELRHVHAGIDGLEHGTQHISPACIAANALHQLIDFDKRLGRRPAQPFAFEEVRLSERSPVSCRPRESRSILLIRGPGTYPCKITLGRTVGASLGLALNGAVMTWALGRQQTALPADIAARLPKSRLATASPHDFAALPPTLRSTA